MPDTPENASPKARKRGGQPCNRNGLRHGLKAGKLPKDALHVEITTNRLRRQLEDAVLAARGAVSLTDASLIQSAVRWERHSALANRWLRMKSAELRPTELMAFSREVARASSERDKAIALLRLDLEPEAAPWVNVPAIADEPEALE